MVKRVESAIQRAVVDWVWTKHPGIGLHATLNEHGYDRGGKTLGADEGITDLILWKRHERILHLLFLELKQKKGKLSESEEEWAENYSTNMEARNTSYAMACGFSAAKNVITDWMGRFV